jgi:hypothetical protein
MLSMERGSFDIMWQPGALSNGPLGPPGAALIAAIDPDGLFTLLSKQIDSVAGSGLPEADRAAAVLTLSDQIRELERQEEGLISEAEEKDMIIQRRPQASPWAVLGVAELVGIQAA